MSADLDKLTRCLPMLSSPHDGEVLSAAWSVSTMPDMFDRPLVAAEWLLDLHESRLREKERDFLETMVTWHGGLTPKKAAWLTSLLRRYGYRA